MNIKYLYFYLGIVICYIVCIMCNNILTKRKNFKITIKIVLTIMILSIFALLNNYFNYSFSRLIIHYLLVFLLFFIIYNKDFYENFIKAILIYSIACTFETILGLLLVHSNEINIYKIDEQPLIKVFFTVIVMLFTLLFFHIDKLVALINLIYNKFIEKKEKLLYIVFVVFFLALSIIVFKASTYLTYKTYIFNVIILIILITFLITFIVQCVKTKKAEEKEEILLNFVSKYEKILDNDRINKHEILNNLLILKGFKNKNSKEYEETLNTIITKYENKDKNLFISLYNLPSGLKGLLYYKVYEMKNFEIDVTINISNKILSKLEKMDSTNFTKLCRILGIILDNAKEAAENSDNKSIVIDIYKDGKKIIIYVENTTKSNVEVNKLYEKNYSTKGKNRGLGLYIAKDIVNNSLIFELEQFINESNKFVSIITII